MSHSPAPELTTSNFDVPPFETYTGEDPVEYAQRIALTLGTCAMKFARVERVPRYDEGTRENDAEHSFMLSLVATEIAAEFYPDLDTGLVSQFSTVHDLIELEVNDVATFKLTQAEANEKEASEHAKLEIFCAKLPPYTAQLVRRYELQQEPEARLVRLVDKILPVIVDIVGPGAKVMEEDYDIFDTKELDDVDGRLSNRLRQKLPDSDLEILHEVRENLGIQFLRVFAQTCSRAMR